MKAWTLGRNNLTPETRDFPSSAGEDSSLQRYDAVWTGGFMTFREDVAVSIFRRSPQTSQKSRSHLKIIGSRWVT
jgi:outer membrane scaffolding protein for murein synthesis (MipA/OmpV family)